MSSVPRAVTVATATAVVDQIRYAILSGSKSRAIDVTKSVSDIAEIDMSGVPSSAQLVTLSIKVSPRSGVVAIFASPNDKRPILQCSGPGKHVVVGYGSGRLFVRKQHGAQAVSVEVVGWE